MRQKGQRMQSTVEYPSLEQMEEEITRLKYKKSYGSALRGTLYSLAVVAAIAILVATLSSVAMSGVPGGGGTGELVLCTVFFPDQMAIAYPIAIALGNLVDPPATMVNAAGDYVVSYIVERFVDGKDWLEKKRKEKTE